MDKDKQIPRYWQSLEERRQDPDFLEQSRDEFPELQANRRDFLKLMGFSLSAASLAACSRAPAYKAFAYLNKPADVTPGVANWYASTCAGCSASCGLLVKARDGRPIKIEGNPESPLNKGGICALGQATVLSLYDDARLKGPSWRGETVSWSSLDRQVRNKLNSISDDGKKIVILSNTLTSPTTLRLIEEFLGQFPQADHIVYDPISYAAILKANLQSFGESVLPSYRFDKAHVIVGVNADFLGTWISPVEYTRQYSSRRKLDQQSILSRHIQFESNMSLTGSNADRRVSIQPSQEGIVLWALLHEVSQLAGEKSVPLAPTKALDKKALNETARELWKNRGKSLVVAGSNDISVQILANALNALLGNIGKTIDLDNPSFQKRGDDGALTRLIEEMGRGEVGSLIVYGANPIYDSADSEKFKKGLSRVDLSISFSLYRDETAAHVNVLAPDLHFLESWNDAQPRANVYHLTQPTIAPLFDTRAAQDSLLKWMEKPTDYYHYLRDYWHGELFFQQHRYATFESFWNQSVHDGVWVTRGRPVNHRYFMANLGSSLQSIRHTAQQIQGPYELFLYQKVAIRDGRQANNPWLQELPDPISKVTWDNYACISPSEASYLGLKQGDVVALQLDGKKVELPVYLQAGQPAKTIAVALGYGRSQAGKVANGVGSNLFPTIERREGTSRYARGGLQLAKTGRHAKLALTQTHNSAEGWPIIKETSLEEYRRNPRAGNEDKVHLISLWPEKKYPGSLWGMVIDFNACTGCSACLIGCQSENNVAVVGKEEVRRRREMHWIRIDRYYSGSEENPDVLHQPMMCQHCQNAPCETVCPVLATVHSSDGLNQQVYNRCVGTRYCSNNCPYKVRRFNWFDYANNKKFDFNMNNDLGKMVLNPDVVVRSRGVMEKCSMCLQRIQEERLKAKREGRSVKDGDIQMACQQSCPADAIIFGDLNDPKSRIAKLVKSPRYYRVLEEINIRPAVGYLTKVRNRKKS